MEAGPPPRPHAARGRLLSCPSPSLFSSVRARVRPRAHRAAQSSGKRQNENVRPIFWANRRKSYVRRTEIWDEFPNGRWGDSRSPAYGELDGYGVSLKRKPEEVMAKWGEPSTVGQIGEVFAQFVNGAIDSLPWSDEPLGAARARGRARVA